MTLKTTKLLCGAVALALITMTATASRAMLPDVGDVQQEAEDSAAVAKDSVSDGITNPNYIDEVVWVVGDEAILLSDIEMLRLQAEQEGVTWEGNPDCRIPEQIAVQKLFLNQAALDSIEVTESEIASPSEV